MYIAGQGMNLHESPSNPARQVNLSGKYCGYANLRLRHPRLRERPEASRGAGGDQADCDGSKENPAEAGFYKKPQFQKVQYSPRKSKQNEAAIKFAGSFLFASCAIHRYKFVEPEAFLTAGIT